MLIVFVIFLIYWLRTSYDPSYIYIYIPITNFKTSRSTSNSKTMFRFYMLVLQLKELQFIGERLPKKIRILSYESGIIYIN